MDKYEQLSVAGEGAYGVVLKCKHKETGEVVAIKKFREPDAADEEAKRLAKREVEFLQSLKHENIVNMKEAFRRKGTLYIVFEHIEKSMMDLVEANPKGIAAETVRSLICQLARALEHCHRHNVLHRDIKPENLLINPVDNTLRLCDFGSARKTSAANSPLTDYVATRWYRAPELLVSFDNYGKGVDMWGLGCVAAELATGQPLFAGTSDIDQLCIIQQALGPLTPGQLERCLELTGFRDIKFPTVSQPDKTLEKRLARRVSDLQLQFLKDVLVTDPKHRLSAKAALSAPWLMAEASARAAVPSKPPAASSPSRRRSKQSIALPRSTQHQSPRSRSASAAMALSPAPKHSASSEDCVGVPHGSMASAQRPPVGPRGPPATMQKQRQRQVDPEDSIQEEISQASLRGRGDSCEEEIEEEIDEELPSPNLSPLSRRASGNNPPVGVTSPNPGQASSISSRWPTSSSSRPPSSSRLTPMRSSRATSADNSAKEPVRAVRSLGPAPRRKASTNAITPRASVTTGALPEAAANAATPRAKCTKGAPSEASVSPAVTPPRAVVAAPIVAACLAARKSKDLAIPEIMVTPGTNSGRGSGAGVSVPGGGQHARGGSISSFSGREATTGTLATSKSSPSTSRQSQSRRPASANSSSSAASMNELMNVSAGSGTSTSALAQPFPAAGCQKGLVVQKGGDGSLCEGSIQEEIDEDEVPLIPEEIDEILLGPTKQENSWCGPRGNAQPQPQFVPRTWGAATPDEEILSVGHTTGRNSTTSFFYGSSCTSFRTSGGKAPPVVDKLGLIQRKGTRFKVT